MGQQASRSKTEILGTLENTLDDNSEFIGVYVWKELHKAYESMDSDVSDLVDELETANNRIAELEERIQELEESA